MTLRSGISALVFACLASITTQAVAAEPAKIVVTPERRAVLPSGLPNGQHATALVTDDTSGAITGVSVTFTLCPPPTSVLGRCMTDVDAAVTDGDGIAHWDVPFEAILEPGTYTLSASVGALSDTAAFNVLISSP